MEIRINLESFDYRSLEKAAENIILVIKNTGSSVIGPIPLPTTIERFTVNTSPHVNKTAREQFEIRTKSRIIIIKDPTTQTVSALEKLDLPCGVDVKIKCI